MKDLNIVMISGRITNIKYSATKKGNEFASVGVVTNSYVVKNNKTESYPTFMTLMCFDEKLITYLKDVCATKGDSINATARITNSKGNTGYVQLSLLTSDIVIAKKTNNNDGPNANDIITSNEIFMEDF